MAGERPHGLCIGVGGAYCRVMPRIAVTAGGREGRVSKSERAATHTHTPHRVRVGRGASLDAVLRLRVLSVLVSQPCRSVSGLLYAPTRLCTYLHVDVLGFFTRRVWPSTFFAARSAPHWHARAYTCGRSTPPRCLRNSYLAISLDDGLLRVAVVRDLQLRARRGRKESEQVAESQA